MNNKAIKMTLTTVTCSDKVSRNGIIYTAEEFRYMLDNQKDQQFKLVKGVHFANENIIDRFTIYEKDILGDIIEIHDGSIDISIPEDKVEYVETALKNGFKPGMRYTGILHQCEDKNGKEICEVTNMHLIAYELVMA